MAAQVLRAATRGSKLALAQTALIIERLRSLFPAKDFEPLVIRTAGDAVSEEVTAAPGKGIFVKELEEALLRAQAAFAVHSLKDLPVELPKGLVIAAVPEREDARDALISNSGARLAELRSGAVIGTSSGRRAAQLLAARPDLRIEPIRGNLDTRIAKLMGRRESPVAYDAIVVAAAGCLRLGLEDAITELLPVDLVLPAPGQGALAIETRDDDAETRAVVVAIEDEAARCAVEAERACLRALGGGCRVPIAAYAEPAGGSIVLRARVCSLDGREIVQGRRAGPAAEAVSVGAALAHELLGRGAARLIGDL
jgi:hydroxymethylbilane synthase